MTNGRPFEIFFHAPMSPRTFSQVWPAVPHARVDPTALVLRKVGAVLGYEDRIGLAELVAGSARVVEPAGSSTAFMYGFGSGKRENIRVIRNVDIGGTPSKLPGVGGQHQDIKARLPRAIEEGKRLGKIPVRVAANTDSGSMYTTSSS